MHNLDRLLNQYSKIFNRTIDVSSWDYEKCQQVLEWVNNKKKNILHESSFNSYYNNKTYTQVLLIEAIVHKVLIEIAPKRIRKKRK